MKFAIRAAIVVLSFSAVARAQAPIDGQWTGEMQADGATKAVTMISGADLTFKTVQRVGDSEQKIACTGTILAGEIQVSCAPEGGAALEFVVRRAAR